MSKRNLLLLNVSRQIFSYNIPKTSFYCNKIKLKRQRIPLSKFNNHERNCNTEAPEKKNDEYNRHRYHSIIEKLMNEQVNTEFTAAYNYLGIALYYGRSTVALPGCYGFFMKMYFEELQHAMDFMKYQTLRGGKVVLQPIQPRQETEFCDVAESFNLALEMEKCVTEKLQALMQSASDVQDTDVQNLLDTCIEHQEKSISEIARLYTRACDLASNEIGRYLFDRELHETHVRGQPGTCTAEVGNKLYT